MAMIFRACAFALVIAATTFDMAAAGSAYDGSWSLTITTERGNCDANYYFQVQVTNGIVSHPNLVKFRGRVTSGGQGYTLGSSIAYGYVPVEHAGAGTRVAIDVFGEWVDGTVMAEPLYDPKSVRVRA